MIINFLIITQEKMNKEELEIYKNSLNDEIINKIVRDFDEGELNNKALIKKYNLRIRPNELRFIIPRKVTNEVCEYCGEQMTIARLRSPEKYKDNVCPSCGHIKYRFGAKKCTCANCEKKEQKKQDEILKQLKEDKETREKIKWEDLSLDDAAKFFYMLFFNKDSNSRKIKKASYYYDEKYLDILNELFEKKILTISPDTDLKEFDLREGRLLYYPSKVDWDVNVEMNQSIIDSLDSRIFPISGFTKSEKREYLVKKSMEYLIDDVREKMYERGREFNPTIESCTRYKGEMIGLSYTQGIYLNYKTVLWALDWYKTKGYRKDILDRNILNFVCKEQEKYTGNGWDIYKSDKNFVNEKLRFLIKNVLQEKTDILDIPIIDLFDN